MNDSRALTDRSIDELVVLADVNVASGDLIPIYDVSEGEMKKVAATGLATFVGVTATVAEVNNTCDASTQLQTLTASGAVTAGKKNVELNHTTVAIAATIATTVGTFPNDLFIKAIAEPGTGQDHTVTITTGTWNGTNKVATFADINDAILVRFDSAGNGTVLNNTGSVAFSG